MAVAATEILAFVKSSIVTISELVVVLRSDDCGVIWAVIRDRSEDERLLLIELDVGATNSVMAVRREALIED